VAFEESGMGGAGWKESWTAMFVLSRRRDRNPCADSARSEIMSYKTVKAIIEVDAALEHELRRHLRDFRAKHPNYGYVLWDIGPPAQPDHPALDPAELLKACREARARAINYRRGP
jgi:hypothetical protein